jgi:hypothetical protein
MIATGSTDHRDRAFWAVEARRIGTDWDTILALHIEALALFRRAHEAPVSLSSTPLSSPA